MQRSTGGNPMDDRIPHGRAGADLTKPQATRPLERRADFRKLPIPHRLCADPALPRRYRGTCPRVAYALVWTVTGLGYTNLS